MSSSEVIPGAGLTTAGESVFFGSDAGALEPVNARTGRSTWQFNTAGPSTLRPLSYAVDGTQYVAIAAGSDVISTVASGETSRYCDIRATDAP